MASFRKRGEKWQAQIRRDDHPPLSKTFTKKQDAERWVRSIESAIDRGELFVAPETAIEIKTLGDLMIRYRKTVTSQKRGMEVETVRINKFLKHPLCKIKVKNVTPSLIAQYRDQRLKAVKAETVRRDLSILSHAFSVAIREWNVPLLVNPVSSVDRPKPSTGRDRRVSEEELNALLIGSGKSRNKELPYLIRLAVHTGMRRGELLAMRWENIHVAQQILLIPDSKNGYSRKIPLGSSAVDIFRCLQHSNEGFVFNSSANALRLAWERLRKRVGLDELHFHDLRHEAISRFFEMGLSLPEVALISGHREPRMLLRYTHLKAENIVLKLS